LKDLTPDKLVSLVLIGVVSLTAFGWLRFSILAAGLVFHPAPLTAQEGLIAYQVGALAAGDLYAPATGEGYSLAGNPPGFHFVLAVLGTVLPVRIAGRLVSTCAAVAVAVLLSLIILDSQLWNRRGARRRTSWNLAWGSYFGVSFVCLFPMTTISFVSQPDALALAFGLLGMLGWLRGIRGMPNGLAYGSVAFLLAASTSLVYLTLPMLCAIAWAFSDRRPALRFLGAWMVSSGLLGLALYAVTDGGIAAHLEASGGSWHREVHLSSMLDFLFAPMGWLTTLGTGAVFWPYYTGRRDPVAHLLPILWLFGWVAVFWLPVDGPRFEVSLMLLATLWMSLGIWMDELSRYLRREGQGGSSESWLAIAVVSVSLAGTLFHMLAQPLVPLRSDSRYTSQAAYSHVVNEVQRVKGAVLAEDVAVLLDAGVSVELADLRLYSRRVSAGELDGAWLVNALKNGRYKMVVLRNDVGDYAASPLTREMKDALIANYDRWSQTDYAVLYRPKIEIPQSD
jgi:hypothetical protein